MKFIKDYMVRIVFAIGILSGVQLPSFIDQYSQRLEAHYLEAVENLSGYQKIADLYHGGRIENLIAKHESSADPTFYKEAEPIKELFGRVKRFGAEVAALNTNIFLQTSHLLFNGDREVIKETYTKYSATIPLSRVAIICGIVTGICASAFLDALFFLFTFGYHKIVKSSSFKSETNM
jgi:Protein of unknown function (DUF2937)